MYLRQLASVLRRAAPSPFGLAADKQPSSESAPDVSQRLSMPIRQGLGNFTLRTEAIGSDCCKNLWDQHLVKDDP